MHHFPANDTHMMFQRRKKPCWNTASRLLQHLNSDQQTNINSFKKTTTAHTRSHAAVNIYLPAEFYPEVKFDIIEFSFGFSDISPFSAASNTVLKTLLIGYQQPVINTSQLTSYSDRGLWWELSPVTSETQSCETSIFQRSAPASKNDTFYWLFIRT